MLRYTVRRILYLVPTLFGVTLLTFCLFHFAGGNPAAQQLGQYANAEQIATLEKEMGLDRPIYEQYLKSLWQSLTFDFGRSWASQQKISDLILDGIGPSLSLTIPSFLFVTALSICIALFMAYRRHSRTDQLILVACLAGMSISSLVYILYMQYWLAFRAGIFPITGWDPSLLGRFAYLALPILIFVLISIGGHVLYFRAIFLEEILSDYVRTARAKGLAESEILLSHVLKNALVPIISLITLEMPFLILGSLLLESFFGIPGLGGLIYQAIQNADYPVIKAMTFFGALLYMFFQLAADLLYAYVDPKVELK